MDWQDIETVPKDGELVMIFDPTSLARPRKLARWMKGQGILIDETSRQVKHATHWHQIPPMPAPVTGFLSVRKRGSKNPRRDAEIKIRYEQTKSLDLVAKEYGISAGRVWQIVKNYRFNYGKKI
jgi:hypothetical protein